jgi:hypothetical protein
MTYIWNVFNDCTVNLKLPTYIYFHKINNEYKITVKIPNKKEKSFSTKKLTLKQKIENAINYLNLQS